MSTPRITLTALATAAMLVAAVRLAGPGPTPTQAATVTTVTASSKAPSGAHHPADRERNPFGAPRRRTDYRVPSPPGEPTLVPTIGTKTTQRLYGSNPFQEAVSVTQHIWPAALPENAPNENNNDPDRPWGLTLVTPDDPLTAITATPLIHFPDDAPILYVTRTGIPQVTLDEIKRLGDTGISRYNNVDAFLVGAAANPAVENQLSSIGIKYVAVTAPSAPDLANKVDQLYGSISNPDTGVPTMGNGMTNVMIGSTDAPEYVLPAAHWVAHMASGLLWVSRDAVPAATIEALKRRQGKARIYLFGGPDQISGDVAKELGQYGTVMRVGTDDAVAFNAPPKDTPADTAIAFAKMWDPMGMVGWKITGPGHGFTLVNSGDWQGAVASSPLSHLGFHAPLLLTDGKGGLSPALKHYFASVAPTFLTTPADGPYNMTYVIGSWKQVTWPVQSTVDYLSEMGNRRLWKQSTGGRYSDSSQ